MSKCLKAINQANKLFKKMLYLLIWQWYLSKLKTRFKFRILESLEFCIGMWWPRWRRGNQDPFSSLHGSALWSVCIYPGPHNPALSEQPPLHLSLWPSGGSDWWWWVVLSWKDGPRGANQAALKMTWVQLDREFWASWVPRGSIEWGGHISLALQFLIFRECWSCRRVREGGL